MFWLYTNKELKLLLNMTLVLFAVFALMLGQSLKVLHTQELALSANTVGVFAGVQENEVNTIVAQLDARESELDAREAMLLRTQYSSDRRVLLFMFLIGGGLLGLILVNFFLDSRRRMSLAG